jgi:putative transcriptional regulator
MTSTIHHHIDTATLMSFSAGTLNGSLAAVVAAHVSTCSHCAREVAAMDLVGATLLVGLPVPLQAVAEDHPPMPRPTLGSPAPAAADAAVDEDSAVIPAPIRKRFGISGKNIRWHRLALGVWHYRFSQDGENAGDLRLLKIAPGYRMLEHGHGGTELTLVLEGAFSDSTGEYLPGDIQEVADEIEHSPVADRVSGCICLIASEERARFRGVVGKVVQAWTGL